MVPFDLSVRCQQIELKGPQAEDLYRSVGASYAHALFFEVPPAEESSPRRAYLCFGLIAEVQLTHNTIIETLPAADGGSSCKLMSSLSDSGASASSRTAEEILRTFIQKFSFTPVDGCERTSKDLLNGLFGYLGYDAVPYVENITFRTRAGELQACPLMRYGIYRYVVAVAGDSSATVQENLLPGQIPTKSGELKRILLRPMGRPQFRRCGEEISNLTDQQHCSMLQAAKAHLQRGDVFQLVLSRRFEQRFEGGEFSLFSSLRRISPSPFSFYFDYGNYKFFGASPELQVKVSKHRATISPIAGTFPRDESCPDHVIAGALQLDAKERSEHLMLVDLARNDLSRHCFPVSVETLCQARVYSHVVHLVSSVVGVLNESSDALQLLTSTFPAGTLTGAPKYRAMQLIDQHEPNARGLYGGAVGCIESSHSLLHAILIRTIFSQASTLLFQAGSGVVLNSVAEREMEEVRNKLAPLRAAIIAAEGDLNA